MMFDDKEEQEYQLWKQSQSKEDKEYQQWKQSKMEPPNFVESMGRGFKDLWQGSQQLGTAAVEGVMDTARFMGADTDYFEGASAAQNEQFRQENALYERGRGDGVDWGRLSGQMAGSAPIGAGLGGGALTTRAVVGGLTGAASGGAMYTPEGVGSMDKLEQVTSGGAGGALIGGAAPHIAGAAGRIFDWIGELAGRFGDDTARVVVGSVEDAAGRAGIDLRNMTDDMALHVQRRVDAALAGGQDPREAARQAVMEVAGFRGDTAPTRGQTSMNPRVWGDEIELSKSTGGQALQERYVQQAQQFRNQTNAMGQGMGGNAADDVAAAQSVSDNVLDQWGESQVAVNKLYQQASKKAEGAETTLENFKLKIDELIDLGMDETIPQLNQALRQFERNGMTDDGLLPVNASRMEQMKIALQTGWENMTGSQRRVVRELTESLNDDMDKMGNPFRKARAAGADRFQKFGNKLVKDVVDGKVNSKNFVGTRILGGEPADIRELRVVLNSQDPQAWQNVRSRVYDYFMRKAYQGNAGSDTAQFSGKQLGKALENRDSVLREVFEPEELATLRNLANVGEWMFSQRPLSYVNNSNTTSQLIKAMQSIGGSFSRMPGISQAGKAMGNLADDFNARSALAGGIADAPKMSPVLNTERMPSGLQQMLGGAMMPVAPSAITNEMLPEETY